MFKIALKDDEPRIVALINRAYRGSGAADWNTESGYISGTRTTEGLLREEVAAKPQAFLLKWEDARADSLAGCVWLEPVDRETWYLGSLAIEPLRQKDGLGKTLLAAAEQWALERGASRIRMSVVNVRDALIAWYVRRGYHQTGETLPFPYGDDRFGTPKRDDLHFVVLEKELRRLVGKA
jgi:GNAT superfamily N-acetyltransferase